MPMFILRDIPDRLWVAVKERRQLHGRPLRPLILDLLTEYAFSGHTPPAADWPAESRTAADVTPAASGSSAAD